MTSRVSLAVVSLVGGLLFVWPFFGSSLLGADVPPDAAALAATLTAVVMLGLVEAASRRLDSGRLALLAVLAAMDAALRLAMVNGVAGFSPIFFLVLVAGYELGGSYGFLVGSYSLLVSALVTGGVGPWLPYETFAVGWVGATAGLAADLVSGWRRLRSRPAPDQDRPARGARGWWPDRLDIAVLVCVAVFTGFAYGALTDIWGWVAFYRGVPDIGWQPGGSLAQMLASFGRYYVATSLVWDSFRAVGDALAILLLGTPVLAAMGRLRARAGYEIVPGAG